MKKRSDEEILMQHVLNAGRQICDSFCDCGYNCFHNHRKGKLYGDKNGRCPLEKYDVYQGLDYKAEDLTHEDLFYLCLLCEHSEVKQGKRQNEIDLGNCYTKFCVDCPVNKRREKMDEEETEHHWVEDMFSRQEIRRNVEYVFR